MFFLNSNLLISHTYKKITEELKLIHYVQKEFRVYNLFKFKHFTNNFLEQSSDLIADFFF